MAPEDDKDALSDEKAGVYWRKYTDNDSFAFPSIVYEFTSTRNDDVELTVEDDIPDSISVRNIGFHNQHGAEQWTIQEDALRFEYELDAGETVETVFCLRPDSHGTVEDFLRMPRQIDLPEQVDQNAEKAQFTRSAAESPYPDIEGSTGDDESAVSGEIVDDASATAGSEQTLEADGTQSLTEQLAAELEDGTPSAESIAALEAQFGGSGSSQGSLDARVSQIETDISSLRAYTSALETFLDENGSAEAIIDDFESRLETFESDLTSLDERLTQVETEVETVSTTVQDVESSVDSLSTEFDSLSEGVDSLETDVAAVEDELPAYDIDEQIDEIETELHTLNTFMDSLRSAFNQEA
jgi:outer membrane murein-binding lipoprotein Lpp